MSRLEHSRLEAAPQGGGAVRVSVGQEMVEDRAETPLAGGRDLEDLAPPAGPEEVDIPAE